MPSLPGGVGQDVGRSALGEGSISGGLFDGLFVGPAALGDRVM